MAMGGYTPMDPEQLEAAAVGMRDVARTCRVAYEAFSEQGFSSAQSTRLTAVFLRCVLNDGGGGNDDA